jgi:DNA-directed RNA polymerases I, II, and III subunit RPABC2
MSEEQILEFEENDIEENDKLETYTNTLINVPVANKDRISRPYITKYEKAKVIGIRAKQISLGAKTNIDTSGLTSSISIAEKEFIEKKTPLMIRRFMPNGKYEDWKISELII